jgi:hypothetical protein
VFKKTSGTLPSIGRAKIREMLLKNKSLWVRSRPRARARIRSRFVQSPVDYAPFFQGDFSPTCANLPVFTPDYERESPVSLTPAITNLENIA